MILIGEKLNSSIPKTMEAMEAGDEEQLVALIDSQEENGAAFLDINTALCTRGELPAMREICALALEHSSCGLMLDSVNPDVILSVLPLLKGRRVMMNSVTLTSRFEELIPAAVETGAGVVALPIGESMPSSLAERMENIGALVENAAKRGLPASQLLIDVLVEALSIDVGNAMLALETIRETKRLYPEVGTVCGLSNISFGLPGRAKLNAAFLAMAMAAGLDAAIIDVNAPSMQDMLATATALCGQDEYCMEYIGFRRNQS